MKRQITELQFLLHREDVDIAIITETHLTPRDRFTVRNYTVLRSDRPHGRGGGTAIILKRSITYRPLDVPTIAHMDITAIAITLRSEETLIAALYIPPNATLRSTDLDCLTTLSPHFLIAGDLNAKHTYWHSRVINPKGRTLQAHMALHDYVVLGPLLPTHFPYNERHSPDVLDVLLLKSSSHVYHIEPLNDLDSDHLPVLIKFATSLHLTTPVYRHFPQTHWRSFHDLLLHSIPAAPRIVSPEDVDTSIHIFTDTVLDAYNSTTSYVCPLRVEDDLSALLPLLRAKRKARRTWQDTGDPQAKRCMNRLNAAVKRALHRHRINHFERYVHAHSGRPADIWKVSHSLLGKSRLSPNVAIQDCHGATHYSPEGKANALADSMELRFGQPSTEEDRHISDEIHSAVRKTLLDSTASDLLPATVDEVEGIIQSLKTTTASGPDKVTVQQLRHLPRTAIAHLTLIFNACFQFTLFPASWKISTLLAIPKPQKNPALPANRRPISILNHFGKVLEKLIAIRLLPLLDDPSRTHHHQFGFKHRHSSIHQLLRLTHFLRDAFRRQQHTLAVFLDIQQAFDSVWHAGLLYKMIQLSLAPAYVKLIHSFLQHRTFQIRMDNFTTAARPIATGVPQGSILAPLLYRIYVHDIPLIPRCDLGLFADDTVYYTCEEDARIAYRTLQRQLNKLQRWLVKWKLKVNARKTHAVLFTARRPTMPPRLRIHDEVIHYCPTVHYLGITLDSKLNFKPHLRRVRGTAFARFLQLYPLFKSGHLSVSTKLLLYKALIRTHLSYGCEIWSMAKPYIKRSLFALQRKISLAMLDVNYLTSNKLLHDLLGIEPLPIYVSSRRDRFRSSLLRHPNPLIADLYYHWIPTP